MDELRSITNKKKEIGFYLKSAWYFESFKDKAIIIILGVLGIWKFFELIFGWLA